MTKQVKWTSRLVSLFIEHGNLSEDDAYIIISRTQGECVSNQARHLNVSESTVHRRIAYLKKLYDEVQKEYPNVFPVRKTSAKETWMDNH